MSTFNFSLNTESAIREYDNQGAYNTLQAMMNRKEQLTVKFYGSKDNMPCAWIESVHVADFDSNPNATDTLDENTDFQFSVLKMLIGAGKTIQYVPLFRERPQYISAILPCFKGKVMFRINRSEDTLDYLRENRQAV